MKLTVEQVDIIQTEPKLKTCVRVVAGAGSGKSTTTSHRAKYLLTEKKISKDKILLMTFSNRAARDLMLKLKYVTGLKAGKLPIVSTIHGMCLDILRYYGQEEQIVISSWDDKMVFRNCLEAHFDCGHLPKGITTSAASIIVDTISELYACYDVKRYLKNLKELLFDNSEQYEKADQNLILQITYRDFYEIVNAANKYKTEHNLLSFDDILYKAFELLKDDEKSLAHFRKRYQYFFIDEAQDNSSLQHLFAYNAFNHGHTCLIYDNMQEIYQFRWSNSDYLKEENLFKAYDDVKTFPLSVNYRSAHSIVKLGNILRTFGKSDIIQEPSKTTKHLANNVVIKHVKTQTAEANQVVKQVKALLKGGAEFKDIAVLTRTNRFISTNLEPAFIENNIPYIIQGSKTKKMTDKSEILYIIHCLQLMVASPRAQVYLAKQILEHIEGVGPKTARDLSQFLDVSLFHLMESNPRKGESVIGLIKFILNESMRGLEGSKLGFYIDTFLEYSKFKIHDRYLSEIKQLFSNWCEIYMEDTDRTFEQIIPDIQTAIDSVDEDTSNCVKLATIHCLSLDNEVMVRINGALY